MKAATAPVMQLILPLAIAAAAIAFGFAVLQRHTGVTAADSYFFSQLITGTAAIHHRAGGSTQHVLWFNLVLAALFTTGAAFAGYKLGPRASLVVLLQLSVLLLLCQWWLWTAWSISCRPLVLLLTMTVAFAAARFLSAAITHASSTQTRGYELMLRNLELNQTKLQLVREDETDRRLLAADLHDQVLNDLKIARQKFVEYKKNPSGEAGLQIENLLSAAMEEIHQVMDDLCPSVLEHLGLAAAADELLRNACRTADMKRRFHNLLTEPDLSSLSATQQALLYRLIQESITNARKHAQAKTLAVNMEKEGREIVIRITDDGKGVDLGACRRGDTRGIRYMRQRADLIGARITWRNVGDGVAGRGAVCESSDSAAAGEGSGEAAHSGTMVEIRLPVQ